METVTYDVAVHKQALPLRKNESVRQFSQELRNAGTPFVARKLNITSASKADIFMVEIFKDKAVFEVFRFGPDVPTGKRVNFVGVGFSRKSDGTFEFTSTTPLERVTTFRQKEIGVTKGKGKGEAETPKEALTKKALLWSDGWQQTEKGFWSGSALARI